VGDVNISVALTTPVISTNIIVSGIVRVSDNIEAVGTIYSSVNVVYYTSDRVLTFYNIKNGLITCLNSASGLSLTLPTGAAIHTGMPTLGFNQSFQWSVMNLAVSTGNIIMLSSADHAYIGNATLTPNGSYRFLTVLTAADTAKTYRICGNSSGGNISPFWICGKVASNGSVLSSHGTYSFTVSKNGTGTYLIYPTNANFSNTNYIVNVSCQVDNAYAHARINTASLSTSSFLIATYVNNTLTDCTFNFTVVH
jgi:hypothetical protein